MSTRKTPYEFQKKAVYAAIKFILNRHKEELYNRHGIIVSPTGSGKSLMIADLADEIIRRFPRTSDGTQTKILILTHNQTLVEQNHEEAETHLGFPCGVYAAKLKRKDRHHQVTFAMIQSLHPNHKTFRDIGRVDIVLVDEAHMIPFKDTAIYREYIDFLLKKNPKMSVTGFTATPYRLDGGLLIEGDNRLFTDQLFDIPVKLLLEQGFLSPLITPSQLDTSMSLDTSGLKLNKDNDFQAKSLATLADNHVEDYLYKALDEAVEHLGDRKKWMIFCPSSESAILATKYLNDKGFSGGCALSPSSAKKAFEKLDDKGYDVSSTLELNTDKVNARNIGNFKYGDARFIVNMDMLTTGFNVNEIDAIILLRPTASLSLYIQILGRGTRTCEGKLNCLVLDFAKNIETHGYFDDPNLPTSKAGVGGGEQPVKYCRKTDEKGKFIKGCDEHREKPLKIQTVYCPDCHMLLIEEKPKNGVVASKASLLSFEEEPIINTYKMLRIDTRMVKWGGEYHLVMDYIFGTGKGQHIRMFLDFSYNEKRPWSRDKNIKELKGKMSESDFIAVAQYSNNFANDSLVHEAIVNNVGKINMPEYIIVDETLAGKKKGGKMQYAKLVRFISEEDLNKGAG